MPASAQRKAAVISATSSSREYDLSGARDRSYYPEDAIIPRYLRKSAGFLGHPAGALGIIRRSKRQVVRSPWHDPVSSNGTADCPSRVGRGASVASKRQDAGDHSRVRHVGPTFLQVLQRRGPRPDPYAVSQGRVQVCRQLRWKSHSPPSRYERKTASARGAARMVMCAGCFGTARPGLGPSASASAATHRDPCQVPRPADPAWWRIGSHIDEGCRNRFGLLGASAVSSPPLGECAHR